MTTRQIEQTGALEQAIASIKAEIKTNDKGVSVVSISGAARLAGVTQHTLSGHFTDIGYKPSKLAQTLIDNGFDTHRLNEFGKDGIPDIALGIILTYYGYQASRYCTKLAQQCCLAFMAIGIRTWLQQSTGWESPEHVKARELQIANEAITLMRNVEANYPGSYRYVVEALGIRGSQEEALNTSLVANRLGLAFNKQLKAFDAIQNATSSESFDDLKEAYYKLASDHAELLKTKTPQPRVEYVDKYIETIIEKRVEVPTERVVIKTEYVNDLASELKLDDVQRELEALKRKYSNLSSDYRELENQYQNLMEIYQSSKNQLPSSAQSRFQLPPAKN